MSDLGTIEEYKELRPANLYDVAANETWLEDIAREGYRLKEFTGWSGVFVKDEPCECRYRMQPKLKKEKKPSDEQQELYRELGWEYVTTLGGEFHIWRCDDPAVPELDTDPVVQVESYRRIKRNVIWTNVIFGGLMVLMLGLMIWFWGDSETPLWSSVRNHVPGEEVLRFAILLFWLVWMVCELKTVFRLMRHLKTGIPLERPKSYRAQKWLARGGVAVLALVLALNFADQMIGEPWDAYGESYDEVHPDAIYVDLRELEGLADDEVVFFGPETKVHELAPRMWFVDQIEDVYGSTQPLARTEYYHLLTERLRPRMESELLYWYERYNEEAVMERQETAELDSFWWSEIVVDGYEEQYVVASLGKNVIGLQYRGTVDLRAQTAYFAELLS